MTEKLYDNDAYASKFGATVLSCEEDKKGFKVVLDKTLFSQKREDRRLIKGRLTESRLRTLLLRMT